ncbi:MAG: hypothetical protein JRC66_08520 [Deltaproteobacteria bacterium]|nr:hypothetical protein [Deltaproteobacteria bacterium]
MEYLANNGVILAWIFVYIGICLYIGYFFKKKAADLPFTQRLSVRILTSDRRERLLGLVFAGHGSGFSGRRFA